MNKVLESIRSLWIKARLNAPTPVQNTIIPRLHEAKEVGRLLFRPNLPIYNLKGEAKGGPLEVTYIGLAYAKPFLLDILFSGEPVEEEVGKLPFWRYRNFEAIGSSDIVIVEATKHLVDRLSRQNAIILPQYVHHVMDVRGTWEDVRSRFRKSIRKNELRWIRKYNYEYDVNYDTKDFEKFFYDMYLPTMNGRHSELSMPLSFQESLEYFQRGCLFRVTCNGDWVSGVVCHFQENLVLADILGVKDGDETLIHQGATAATYYAVIEWANQNNYDSVNFLGSGPYMNTGRFQHKRKWGMTVVSPQNLHRRLWLKIQRLTPAVIQFLNDNPLVVIDDKGELNGLIIDDDLDARSDQTKKLLESKYATPGINNLHIHSISSYFNGHQPHQVIPDERNGIGVR